MADYRFTQFTDIVSYSFPTNVATHPFTPGGRAFSMIARLPGGAHFDQHGAWQAPVEFPYELTIRGTLTGDDEEIRDFASLWGAIVGVRDNLYRTTPAIMPGYATEQYCDARLVRLDMAREVRYINHQPFTMDFEIFSHFTTGLVEETDTFTGGGQLRFVVEGDLDLYDFIVRVENQGPGAQMMDGVIVRRIEEGPPPPPLEETTIWQWELTDPLDPIHPPDPVGPPIYTVGGAWVVDAGRRSVNRHRRVGTIESAYTHFTVDPYYRNRWGHLPAGEEAIISFSPDPGTQVYHASVFYYPRYA